LWFNANEDYKGTKNLIEQDNIYKKDYSNFNVKSDKHNISVPLPTLATLPYSARVAFLKQGCHPKGVITGGQL
jgi:hypothetical protein